MRKWICVFLLIFLLCAAVSALADRSGIAILSPKNGDVLNPADDMVLFSFLVPEGKEEETFTYILRDHIANEVLDLDEIMADPDDLTGVIGFDMSIFEKGGSYSIRITGNEDTSLDAAVDFKIGMMGKQTDESDDDGSDSLVETAPQEGYAISLISPENGTVIEAAENPEIQFLWILDEYPVEDIPYTWVIEMENGESLLTSSGRMNSSRKQYGFAVPSSLFTAGNKYAFRIESDVDSIESSFSIVEKPEPAESAEPEATRTPEPAATATPKPTPTPTPVPTPTPEPKKTQEQLIAAASAQLGMPKSYISKVRMSGDTAYPFAAEIQGGTIAGDSTLRIISPSNGAVMSFHNEIFFEVNIEALQPITDRLVIQFTDVVGDNVLYILYYEKTIESGKTTSLAVPCRYFTPNTLIRLSIDSVDSGSIHSETLFSFRGYEPTPEPTATPAPAATPAPTVQIEPESAAASEPETSTATEPVKSAGQPADTSALSVQIEEIEGRVKIHREGTINVRALPDEKSERIGIAKANSSYRCTGITENGWYRIVLRDGRQGFVSQKLCRLVYRNR